MDVEEGDGMADVDEMSSGFTESSSDSRSHASQVLDNPAMAFQVLRRKDAIKQLQSFDLESLRALATRVKGDGTKCTILTSMTRIGAANIVLFIEFDDVSSTRWVTRFPLLGKYGLANDPKLLTESIESMITTMQYVSKSTTIPTPKIHCWSSTSENELKRPYVIMDATCGTSLYELERMGVDMDALDLTSFVDQWAKYTAELASIQFGQIGSLKRDAAGDVFVDRLCSRWNVYFTPRVKDDIFRGPFHSAAEYLLTSCELKYQALSSAEFNDVPLSYRKYLRLKLLETLIPYYVYAPLLKGPFVLGHIDFNIQNILVNEKDRFKITGIIDWDLAAVLPLQSHLRVPDILMCDTWTETMRLADGITWEVNFAKKYRTRYQSSLIHYLQEKQLNYPAETLLQNGYQYYQFERALMDTPEDETIELLWTHVYGTESDWKSKVEGIMSSDWGVAMAEQLSLPLDESKIDNGEVTPSDELRTANSRVGESSLVEKDILPTPLKPRSKWTSRLSYKLRRGWNHVQQSLLCQAEPIRLPPRMRSNPHLRNLWWTSKHG